MSTMNSELITTQKPEGRPLFDGKDESEVLAKLESAFTYGASDREACIYAGISPDSLYRYQTKNPEFRERKMALKAYPVMRARQTVVKALETDVDTAFKYLERHVPDEFGLKTKVKVEPGEGLGGTTTNYFLVLNNIDDPDRRRVIETTNRLLTEALAGETNPQATGSGEVGGGSETKGGAVGEL